MDYYEQLGCNPRPIEHSRSLSTSDIENNLGGTQTAMKRKVLRKRVTRKLLKSLNLPVTTDTEEINVKAKLSPKLQEKNMSDLLEMASKSDTSHDVEVDVTVMSISSTECCANKSESETQVQIKEEPNTSSTSTPRVMNTYLSQQSTENGTQEKESKYKCNLKVNFNFQWRQLVTRYKGI